jgi:hypothetical protein
LNGKTSKIIPPNTRFVEELAGVLIPSDYSETHYSGTEDDDYKL